ncbi:MAG TPA: FtsX-like permease family protein, partial [Thermoleophilia bacterium]|nr:FtsX-like permease family protein [Thermoleophilia bacterium]HQJ98053.1 FtsX-like permease family protein [Thermoleophilia bacterium]
AASAPAARRASEAAIMLSLRIAARFLRRNPVQSGLIAAGIAVGIGVQVFLGSLITSLQQNLVDETVGSSPQVTVVAAAEGDPVDLTPTMWDALSRDDRVTTAVPVRRFSAIYRRKAESVPLQVVGGDLGALDTIYDISKRVVAGRARLSGDAVIVGKDFAKANGLAPGDAATLVLPDGRVAGRTVTAVADFGAAAANETLAFVPAGFAGDVLDLGDGQYTAVEMQVSDVFQSTAVADALRADPAFAGTKVTEWQSQNQDLLTALQSQSSSSYTIQAFVLIAVALGIASTLAISAVQKTRQIGILKAMGMHDSRAGRIFLWQAALLGVTGAAVGVGVGLALIVLFSRFASTFTITPQWSFVAVSFAVGVLVALLSSLIPSRRTSRLDPIEVIQSG